MTDVKTVSALELETKISLRLPPLFRSFWIAGFECSCQINSHGRRLDMTAALRHDVRAWEDYAMLQRVASAPRATACAGTWWIAAAAVTTSLFAPMVKAARDMASR
jgi:creatinine amidohydrolase/Fe(II)-dependent formamide hydrolase-like protein